MMNLKTSILFSFLSFSTSLLFGQRTFSDTKSSKNYDVKITVAKCEDTDCSGKGTVSLYKKGSTTLVQTLTSKELNFMLNEAGNPSQTMELYDEQTPVFLEDFNFDGTEDIAIRNGNNSGYGGASYDVYVYNITQKQFVLSKELTQLASTNLGLFEVDTKRKRLITFSKSGCCMHWTAEYEVVPQKGLLKVLEIEEDATGDSKMVKVTTKTLEKGKWKTKTEKFKTSEYYKD